MSTDDDDTCAVCGVPIEIVWSRAPEGDWYIADVRGGCCPRGFPAITHHTPTKRDL